MAATMNISVVIPVYNVAPYVRQAIESALAQPQVVEVVVVDDGSTDESLTVCQAVAAEHPQVKVFQHPNGANLGPSVTRNLGIEKASAPWVAFLDADDYYLPNRFATTEAVIQDPLIDGVYEAAGWQFENEAARQRWIALKRKPHQLMTFKHRVAPEQLFEAMMLGTGGTFSLDGLTVKHEALMRIGGFNPALRVGQDNLVKVKLAFHCRLAPGEITEPVAMARVHDSNNVSGVRRPNERAETDTYMREFWAWGQQVMNAEQLILLRKYFARYVILSRRGWLAKRYDLTRLLLRWPRLATYPYFWASYGRDMHFIKRVWQRLSRWKSA